MARRAKKKTTSKTSLSSLKTAFKQTTFKRLYNKEPISSFLLLVGIMEGLIGGVHGQWSLFSLGLGLVLGAFVVRRSQLQQARLDRNRVLPRRYLPPSQKPQQPLPPLGQLPTKPLANNKRRSSEFLQK
jgi:hypothetical protein